MTKFADAIRPIIEDTLGELGMPVKGSLPKEITRKLREIQSGDLLSDSYFKTHTPGVGFSTKIQFNNPIKNFRVK